MVIRISPASEWRVPKTVDSFDFKAQPSVNEQVYRELLRGEYLDNRENVLLVGNSGTGKTHLATALGFAACAQGRMVRFYGVMALVTELLEARENRKLERLMGQLTRNHLLILDELGYVPSPRRGRNCCLTW